MTRIMALGAAALLAACSSEESGAADEVTPDTVAEVPAHDPPAPANGVPGRAYHYTSLAECEVVREEREEMPFVETLCQGPAGWALRVTDSDARQNLVVVPPDGRDASLELSRIGGGGFSSLGDTAEWRGPTGSNFRPDALIVRYRVAENPHPEPETAYLLVVDLAPRPCVVARVALGPAQNEIARARADDPGACL
jgi:hypothetical protein